jgi:hypothetical protein
MDSMANRAPSRHAESYVDDLWSPCFLLCSGCCEYVFLNVVLIEVVIDRSLAVGKLNIATGYDEDGSHIYAMI